MPAAAAPRSLAACCARSGKTPTRARPRRRARNRRLPSQGERGQMRRSVIRHQIMRLGESRLRKAMTLAQALAFAAAVFGCSSTPPPKDEPLDADPPGPVEVGKKAAKRP